MIKKNSLLFIFVISFSLFTVSQLMAQAEFSEKILAVVNGEAITQTDVDEILTPIYSQYKNTYAGEDLKKKLELAKTDILNQLIEDKLILQEAKKQNLAVEEKEVAGLINELKNNFQSEEEFANTLKSQNITIYNLKKRYQEQLLIKKMVEKEVLSKIIISPTEVAEFYDQNKKNMKLPAQVRLRDIFIKISETDKPEEILKKVNSIYEQLKKGTEFMELVEKYSEDENVVEAGEMGYLKQGTMVKEIEEAVFKLNAGEFTPPVKTAKGYYIFKLEDKKETSIPPLSDVQDEIRKQIFQEKSKTIFIEWIKKLKESAFVEVRKYEEKS